MQTGNFLYATGKEARLSKGDVSFQIRFLSVHADALLSSCRVFSLQKLTQDLLLQRQQKLSHQ